MTLMVYWVIDQAGQIVAAIPESDPEFQRILAKARPPVAPTAVPAQQPQPQWAAPAPTQPPRQLSQRATARMPSKKAEAYRIKHIPTGRYLGIGLDPTKETTPKVWTELRHARNAVTVATKLGRGSKKEYEIVPVMMTES